MGFIIRYKKGNDPTRYVAYDAPSAKYKLSHIGRAAAFKTREDAELAIDFLADGEVGIGGEIKDFNILEVPPDNKRPPKVLQKPPPTVWARLLKDD